MTVSFQVTCYTAHFFYLFLIHFFPHSVFFPDMSGALNYYYFLQTVKVVLHHQLCDWKWMEKDATNAPKDMARDKTPLTFRVLFTITKGDRGASNCLKRIRGSVGVKLFVRRTKSGPKREGKERKRQRREKKESFSHAWHIFKFKARCFFRFFQEFLALPLGELRANE